MSKLDSAKLLAEIAKLGADIYGIVQDKKRDATNQEKDARIRALEAEIVELKRRLEVLQNGSRR